MLLFIVLFFSSLSIKKILKLLVLYNCFHSVGVSDLERSRKAGELDEGGCLHHRESTGKDLLSDPFN